MKYIKSIYILFILIKVINCDKITEKINHENLINISDGGNYDFAEEFEILNHTGIMPYELAQLSQNIKISPEVYRLEIGKLFSVDKKFLCTVCHTAALLAIKFVKNTPPSQSNDFKKQAVIICVTFKLSTKDICTKVIDIFWPSVYHILKYENIKLNHKSVCGVLMQGSNCGIKDPNFDWSLEIDPSYPELNSSKQTPNTYSSAKNLKILVLTDIHYDSKYLVGGDANCNEPLCCRNPISSISNSENGAGKWSDYNNCDVPWDLFADTLDHIKNEHGDFDLIYFTGDVIEHAVWETSKAGNSESIKKIIRHMKKVFGNVTVLPILGNHEPSPVNLYAPSDITDPNLSTQWVYDLVAEEWKDWLFDSSAQLTIKKEGYYTYSPRKGFRVVSLNNNNAYTFNFWLLYNPTAVRKQLEWLHDVLLKAEKANEYVHILMHIPSGDSSCFNTWSREFRRLIERFHPIIGGIFNGHTHNDEFNVYYSLNNSNYAINVAWNGGSLTPFSYLNPNYRIYEVETTTYQVVKHETWIFNLTDANLHPNSSPRWFKEYSFADAYNLENLSPNSLDQLVERFSKNNTLLYEYWERKVKYGDPSLKKGCNAKCLEELYCDIVTTQSNDNSLCKHLYN